MDLEKIQKDVEEILKGADLSQLSARKVRGQLEEKYKISLIDKKTEIDRIVMDVVDKIEEEKDNVTNGNAKKRKKEPESEEDDDSDENNDIKEKTENENDQIKTEADEDIARQLQEEEEESCLRRTRHSNKKRATSKAEKKPRKKSAPRENSFTESCNLSPELAAIVGEEKMKRSEVVKKMWTIVKEKNLFDPKNKRFMLCDDQMFSVFGKKRVLLFGMMKYLSNHIYKSDEVLLS